MEQKGLLLLLSKLDRYNARVVVGATRHLAELVASGGFDSRLYAALSGTTVACRACASTGGRSRSRESGPLDHDRSQGSAGAGIFDRRVNRCATTTGRANLLQLQTTVRRSRRPRSKRRSRSKTLERARPAAIAGAGPRARSAFDLPAARCARRIRARVFRLSHQQGRREHQPCRRRRRSRAHASYRKLKQLGIKVRGGRMSSDATRRTDAVKTLEGSQGSLRDLLSVRLASG